MAEFRNPALVKALNILFAFVAFCALSSLIIEYGFDLSLREQLIIELVDFFIILYFILYSVLKLYLAYDRYQYLISHWFNYLLVMLVLVQMVFFVRFLGLHSFADFLRGVGIVKISKVYIIGFQIFILLSIISHGVILNQKIASFRFHPAQVLMLSFLFIISVGTALLMLPHAVKPGNTMSFINALFTATSATCVTGLVVVDTGQYLSFMGQLIVLGLIQVGALGIMSYASFFALILGRNIGLRERLMMRDILNYESMDVIYRLLTSTIIFTMVMEILGAILLFIGFQGHFSSINGRIYSAVFHSISAFCNAGFSLNTTSLMGYSDNYLVVMTVAILIIFGGLGFPVIVNIFSFRFFSGLRPGKWLSVQSRLVLGISGFLVLSGLLFYLLTENSLTLTGMSWPEKVLNAFFQSVTTRTAGFNTLNISAISIPTALFFMILMFIGASPGSTGGGIKTTTAGILLAGVWSVMKGRNRVELFKKNIPFTVLNRSIVILLFSIVFLMGCIILLSFSEAHSLIDIAFEAVSAFGTVGLSRGITPFLSLAGKIIITALMFFGRIGALTISLAITNPRETYHYTYPSENVMVG